MCLLDIKLGCTILFYLADKRKAINNEGPAEKLSRMTDREILTDLIVLGLPYAASEDDMKKHFEQFGALELCEVSYFMPLKNSQ